MLTEKGRFETTPRISAEEKISEEALLLNTVFFEE